ncbi:MAG: HNH endonuclease [Dehalococcoidales bacterium]|nr:HNH endonuclease [Dehalococcoidales bacterium]
MKAYIGVTDTKWYSHLRTLHDLEEVNFWRPSSRSVFKTLAPGELFLFKLHYPTNAIVGGGFFAHYSVVPISLAWESFGEANGASSYRQLRHLITTHKNIVDDGITDFLIGCIILEQPFFLNSRDWIPAPSDWKSNIVQGKTYDLSVEPGRSIWQQLQTSVALNSSVGEEAQRYGAPTVIYPRLGQGSFRVLVTDAYDRKCAVTNERTLPALDAAHIKPYSEEGSHTVNNGILLRKDLHALFDAGYITISPHMDLEVSKKIREEYENGRDYYRLHGSKIRLPSKPQFYPSQNFLEWHHNNKYKG